MPALPIDKAKAGMIVTDKVANDKGMVILQAGTELTDALISRLQKWGVKEIPVEGADIGDTGDAKSAEEIAQGAEKQLERLTQRFKPVMDDAIMSEVFKAIQIHIQQMQEQEETGEL